MAIQTITVRFIIEVPLHSSGHLSRSGTGIALPTHVWWWLRWLVVAFLIAHGTAHAVGFAVAWHLTSSPDVPYHTTLFNGRADVGETGMRVVGLLWLVGGLAFVGSAVSLAVRHPLAQTFIVVAGVSSLLLCAAEWPFSRIGLIIDVVLVVALAALAAF